jgi:hypothetical protein
MDARRIPFGMFLYTRIDLAHKKLTRVFEQGFSQVL